MEPGYQSAHARGARGQILVEIGVAIGVIATLAAMTASLIVVAQRGQVSARRQDAAASFASEAFAVVRAVAASNANETSSGYNRIYCPPYGECDGDGTPPADEQVGAGKGSGTHYQPVLLGDHWELDTGDQTISHNGIDFTRFVTIENVCRDGSGDIVACGTGYDPSTQKVTVTMQAPNMADLVVSQYMTRASGAIAASQTDWSGGTEADTDPTGASVVEFEIDWNDADGGERVRGFVCKTAEIDAINYKCPGGAWVQSPGWTTNPSVNIVLYYTPTAHDAATCNDNGDGTYGDCGYDVYICDDGGSCSAVNSSTFNAAL